MRSTRFAAKLLIVSLLMFVSMANIPSGQLFDTTARASAVKPKKLSDDLKDKVAERPNDRVRVLIQTGSGASVGFANAVNASGGRVNRRYRNLPVVAVDLPAREVSNLAARNDVKFVSLDKKLTVTGHLEVTTGADQARASSSSTGGGSSPPPHP
ncbi:MAG TPA: hypothetical protein VJZ26_08000, partial [Blastocatellia bacterium]|nr:hypothetical protein [Blastocatellia bacterium]